jgi:ankyrin repeat protein
MVKKAEEMDKIMEGWEECKEFFKCVEEGDREGAKRELEKNSEFVKRTDGNRKTALHIAASLGHHEILKDLIGKFRSIIVRVNSPNTNIIDIFLSMISYFFLYIWIYMFIFILPNYLKIYLNKK